MKRLEIIHARMSTEPPVEVMEALHASAASETNGITIEIFRNETLSTDLSIHVHYLSSEHRDLPSHLGKSLAAALREYGMVEHTVWIESGRK